MAATTKTTTPKVPAIAFASKDIAHVGNEILSVLLLHEADVADAKARLEQADERDKFIDVELTRIAMMLHAEDKIDVFNVFAQDRTASSALYNNVLTAMGVLEQKQDKSNRIIFEWTDKELQDKYEATAALKERDPDEYNKRRSRSTMLKSRLSRAAQAAVALIDAGADQSAITYRDNEETGAREVVIAKAPKEIVGKDDKTEVVLHIGSGAKAREGAKYTPSIVGLAKSAQADHKPKTAKTSTEDKGGNTESVSGEEDFLALVNTLMSAVAKREGNLTTRENTALKNLTTRIKEAGVK